MRADRPKQYLQVAGRCIIEHTLDCFSTIRHSPDWWSVSRPTIRTGRGSLRQ